MALDPNRFFLPAVLPGDDQRFRAPARLSALVTPLIDARDSYAEMERTIIDASETIHLCWWEFNPFTELQTGPLPDGLGTTWVDLLVAKATGGSLPTAHVRMIVADCDALFFNTMHEKAWFAFETLVTRRQSLDPAAQARLEVIVGLHPATVEDLAQLDFLRGRAVQAAVDARIDARIDALNEIVGAAGPGSAEATEAADRFRNMPGLWRNVIFDATTATFSKAPGGTPMPTLRPASHHQKLCLIDGRIGFCGGLDIAPERIDDGRHDVDKPWHDVQCRIEGPPVFDMERNFFARWNAELALFRDFVDAANATQPPLRLDKPRFSPMARPTGETAFGARPGASRVQMLRTITGQVPGGDLLPDVIRRDIEEGYLKAISQARQFIYIENQYLRWAPIADAIVARHAATPIKVIVVVPTLPEEIRAASNDLLVNHQQQLQAEFLNKLAIGLGADFGLFALAQRRFAVSSDPLDLFASAQVYVHSKLMIVDDAFATIGSANGNGRGFTLDGEINIAWSDPRAIRRFRLELWSELLGRPRDLSRWTPDQFVARWQGIAFANIAIPAEARSGFVVAVNPGVVDPKLKLPLPGLDRAS